MPIIGLNDTTWTHLLKDDPREIKLDSRWTQLSPDVLPEQFRKVRERLYYDSKRDDVQKQFYIDWIVIGIYPNIFFLPIEVISTDVIHANGYTSTEYSYKITGYDLFFKAKAAYKEKDPIKYLIKNGIITKSDMDNKFEFYPYKWESDCWQVGNSCYNKHNPIYYGIILEELGFKFDDYYGCFKYEYTKIFQKDYLNCPLFTTCLNFYDYLCNMKLSSIKVNTSLDWKWKNGQRIWTRTDFIEFKLPFEFYSGKIEIADHVLDWYTAANEPDELNRTDKQILESHGMNEETLRGYPYHGKKNRGKNKKK